MLSIIVERRPRRTRRLQSVSAFLSALCRTMRAGGQCLDAWVVCAATFGRSPARVNCQHSRHSALDECCCSDQVWGSALKTESKSEGSVKMPAAGSVMLFGGRVRAGAGESGLWAPFAILQKLCLNCGLSVTAKLQFIAGGLAPWWYEFAQGVPWQPIDTDR